MHALMPLRTFSIGYNFIPNKYKRQYDLSSFLKVSLKWMMEEGYFKLKNIHLY